LQMMSYITLCAMMIIESHRKHRETLMLPPATRFLVDPKTVYNVFIIL
jgi:hypothetical protein